jgi:hypothetical protein
VLAGVGEDETTVVDAQLLAPAGIEERGIHGGHAGDVGISFGGHIEAAGACAFDQRNAFERIDRAGAVDVNNVQRRAGDGGRADDFLDSFDGRAGLEAPEAPHVRIHREFAFGGDAEHVDHLESSRARSVLNAHADAESASVEFVTQALLNLLDLLRCCRFVRSRTALGKNLGDAGAGINCSRVQGRAEDQGSRRRMAGGGAVVNERVPFLHREKLRNVGRADFHFQRGGYAVEGFDALAGEVLAVLMEIDEAGCDDQAGGVDDAASADRGVGDAGDFAVADADVADRVEVSLGVEDAAAFEDEIVLLRGGERGCEGETKCGQETTHEFSG